MNATIYIRVDANEEIATGHLMRCLTIAKKIDSYGGHTKFIISDDDSKRLLDNSNREYICLNTDYRYLDNELELVTSIIKNEKCKLLLIDSYYVTDLYISELKKYTKIACFDDMFLVNADADVVINYNIFHNIFDYQAKYAGYRTRLLLGEKYVPLREEFAEDAEEYDVNREKNEVLVICGGGDKYSFLLDFLNYIVAAKLKNITWNIIAGAYNNNTEQMKVIACNHDNINIMENISNMAYWLRRCAVLVSAASTVLYESCACGIPTVFFCSSDDQVNDITAFTERAGMIYAGDVRNDKENVIKECCNKVVTLLSDEKLRGHIEDKEKKLIDVKGAERIAKELMGLL